MDELAQTIGLDDCLACEAYRGCDAFSHETNLQKTATQVPLATGLNHFLRKHADKIVVSQCGCFEWQGSTAGKMGYGNAWCPTSKRMKRAHRMAYESAFGEIPYGLCACHSCDNPLCCNPAHIFIGTQSDNMIDKVRKGRANPARNGGCSKGVIRKSPSGSKNIRYRSRHYEIKVRGGGSTFTGSAKTFCAAVRMRSSFKDQLSNAS